MQSFTGDRDGGLRVHEAEIPYLYRRQRVADLDTASRLPAASQRPREPPPMKYTLPLRFQRPSSALNPLRGHSQMASLLASRSLLTPTAYLWTMADKADETFRSQIPPHEHGG